MKHPQRRALGARRPARWRWTSAGAALALALVPAAALAQDPDPPRDPGLPSLTPRVFESRGTVRVSLPDIERQPLSGFGPPPRTYVVPAEREPVVRPFAPDLDALPALAVAPPPEPVAAFDPGARLRAEGGAGLQLARYGRLDLQTAGAAGAFFVDADYDGVSDGGDDGRVAFDELDLRAGGQSRGPGRLRLEGSALYDRYRTPGRATVTAEWTRRAFGAEAGVEGVGRTPYAAEVRFEQTRLLRDDDLELETNEGRVDADARLALGPVRLDAAAGTAGAGGLGTDVQYAQAGAAVVIDRAETGARLVLGLRGLTYDASSLAGGGDSRAVGPVVDLALPLGPGTLFAVNRPRLAVRTLSTLSEANPYLAPGVVVAPDVLVADAQAGLAVQRGPALLRAYATGLWAPTYLVFNRTDAGFAERYVEARALGIGADAAVLTGSGVSLEAAVEARSGETETGGDLPFFAPLLGRAGLAVPFLRGRGRVGLAAYGEAGRPDGDGGDAPAWGLLSAEVRVDVSGPFAAVVRGERLVGEAERWPGFPRPPFAVTAGLRYAR
jgi:hypothetical protein